MPAPKRKLKPQTPGKAIEPEKLPPQVEEVEERAETPSNDLDEVTLTKKDLKELVTRMVDKQLDERVVAKVSGSSPGQTAPELPDQSEVDATKITRAVLTKQGWVCPAVHASDRIRMQKGGNV